MSEYTPYGTVVQNLDHQTLKNNGDWLEASARLYAASHNGKKPEYADVEKYSGDTFAEKLADYGLMQMAGFNYNIGDQAIDTYNITQKADQRTKEAFVYMMDQYDEVNTSWHTAKQAGWEMATDFTNWIGLGTLGVGAVIGQTAKVGSKAAFKKVLKDGFKQQAEKSGLRKSVEKVGMIAGLEGAAHGAAYDSMKQNVKIDAGAQDEFSYQSLGLNTGIGFGAGLILGTGVDLGLTKLSSKKAAQKFDAYNKELNEKAEEAIKRQKAEQPVKTKDTAPDGKPLKDEDVVPQERTIENPEGKPKVVEKPNFILVKEVGKDLATTGSKTTTKAVDIDVRALSEDVKKNGYDAVDRLIEELDKLELTEENWYKLKRDSNIVNRIFLDEDEILTAQLLRNDLAQKERDQLFKAWEKNQANLRIMDTAAQHLNSGSGRQLQVATYRTKLRKGINEDGSQVSEKAKMIAKREILRNDRTKVENEYNRKIQRLFDEDTTESIQKALDLNMEKNKALTELDVQIEKNFTDYDKFNKFVDKYVEMSISGVFSPATVIINTVYPTIKTYTYPMLDFLIKNPLSREKFSRTIRVYSQMFAATAAAGRAARNAFEFEQTTLTADFSRFMDGGIKVKGRIAGGARVFPRLLGATDAYVQEVAAAGYLAGDAFDGLLTEGIEKGLKGDKLKNT